MRYKKGYRQSSQSSQTEAGWVPKTKIGKLVQEGKLTSLEDIFTQGQRIMEPEIVDVLLPEIKQEVLGIGFVQKQTDAGEKSRFKAIVVVGNNDGYIGVGEGKAPQVRMAINKATTQAKLNIVPLKRGCGSWECGCKQPHSLPFKVRGKCGSVTFELHPAPRGLGLVGGEVPKNILTLAGIKDCWTRSYGSTSTLSSTSFAIFNCLKDTYHVITPKDWVS
ncbi:MAG: 30S ribosomal protein S5 [Candidatus Bathyarchaeota archaeon]|nr:30S ribosomal protein S5 [Candidatus Bathyarchaeota archaeon]